MIVLAMIACAALLIVLAGCARQTNRASTGAQAGAQANVTLTNDGQPVRLSAGDADGAEPATASGRDGSVYVAWVEHRPEQRADVMLARFDATGRMQGEAARVNSEAGLATAWRGDPPTVAVAQDGGVYVGWTKRVESSTGQADDLYLSASHDGGRTFAAVKVNDDSRPAAHGMHSLTVGADGRIYLAWLDERNVTQPQPTAQAGGHHMEGNREVFMTSSMDGGRTFAPNQRVATDVCPCCKTSLAAGSDNRLYVSWRQVLPDNYRHIAVASTTDGGRTFSPRVIVSDDRWQLEGCPVSGSALAVGADGSLRVLWFSAGDAGETGLYWSESRDGGQTFAKRQLFSKGQAYGTPILIETGDHLTAVWGASAGGSTRLMTGQLDGAGHVTANAGAAGGELPAAATTNGRLVVSYISKSGDRRAIWLARG
jgi:hypothetical protein